MQRFVSRLQQVALQRGRVSRAHTSDAWISFSLVICLGKISKAEIENTEVNDMPPRYRLACQYFVRNEDIIVSFEGDETLPAQGPHITHAASRFKGGTEIDSVYEFLGYAVKVEEDAAIHYEELAAAMESCGNQRVATLFRQLGGFSRRHLAEAKARAGSVDPAKNVPPDYVWPSHVTPERASVWAADSTLSRIDALKAALQGEKRGYEFYCAVAAPSKSPEVAAMAKEFVKELSLSAFCTARAMPPPLPSKAGFPYERR